MWCTTKTERWSQGIGEACYCESTYRFSSKSSQGFKSYRHIRALIRTSRKWHMDFRGPFLPYNWHAAKFLLKWRLFGHFLTDLQNLKWFHIELVVPLNSLQRLSSCDVRYKSYGGLKLRKQSKNSIFVIFSKSRRLANFDRKYLSSPRQRAGIQALPSCKGAW